MAGSMKDDAKKQYEKIRRQADANLREYHEKNPEAAKRHNRSVLLAFGLMGVLVILVVVFGLLMKP